ncbi:hypothetical protein DYB32_006239 [Aphanomyces invadans]|uniref:N-acetyltransferase domain-containing protein n=1 Tax=Aphanomyces invadans TaxID=157072 RepID=A0A3R6YWZ2_9STRA|nr:hypothetical protein DYB32_006239 [Aphanomyces invadans]
MAITVVRRFVSLALGEPLPSPFVGPLINHLVSSPASPRLLKLYVLREHSIQDFDDEKPPQLDDDSDAIVGLAFSFVSDNQHDKFGLHFWFRSSIAPSTATRTLAKFLRHATTGMGQHMLGLRAVEHSHYVAIQDSVTQVLWKDTNGCRLYLLDAATPVKSLPIGATFNVDGDVYMMDTAVATDAAPILSLSSIGYGDEYIVQLLKHPVLSKLMRVVRVVATKTPVSWALVHHDFSLGLVGTDPAYRRKGLVRLAFGSTIDAYREAIRSGVDGWFGLQPHCFVLSDNYASQGLMASMGFVHVQDKEFHWMGVIV